MARRIGDLDFLLRAGRRRSVEESLSRAFEDSKNGAAIRRLTRQCFQRRWVGRAANWRMLDKSSASTLENVSRMPIDGLGHLQRALDAGRGAILWGSPFGSSTVGALAVQARGIPFTMVHGPEHGGASSWVGQRIFRRRHAARQSRIFEDTVLITDESQSFLSELIARLRRNRVIWMGNVGTSGRLFFRIEFLGLKQLFAAGVAGLAALTGAPLIPAFCFLDSGGERRLVLGQPFELRRGAFAPEHLAPVVQAYARLLESYIRKHPLQWTRWYAPILDSDVAHIEGVTVLDVSESKPAKTSDS